jgi:DNA (cytosine-5)-methyltransferase 1
MGGLQVIGELAEIGYDAEWRVVSAAGVGAPHRRERIIIVAYASQLHCNGSNNNSRVSVERETISQSGNDSGPQGVAYANDSGDRASQRNVERKDEASSAKWVNSQHEPRRCSPEMEHAASARCKTFVQQTQTIWTTDVEQSDLQERFDNGWWETEPDVGRVADGISNRVDRLRGLGNAVVPQVAEYIGRLVMAAHNNT